MFGDPDTTPGGKAIPFHASTRIKLGAGSQIKDGDDVIGINVSAKTVKNKVAPPFRKINFEIHFGVGIKEHEQIFDILRKNGPETHDGKTIEISGTGGWKNLSVCDSETGEIIVDKKFRKSEFDEIITHPEYGVYIDQILEEAMVKVFNSDPDIDLESLSEMEAIALELDQEVL